MDSRAPAVEHISRNRPVKIRPVGTVQIPTWPLVRPTDRVHPRRVAGGDPGRLSVARAAAVLVPAVGLADLLE